MSSVLSRGFPSLPAVARARRQPASQAQVGGDLPGAQPQLGAAHREFDLGLTLVRAGWSMAALAEALPEMSLKSLVSGR